MINKHRLNEVLKYIEEGKYQDIDQAFNCHGLTMYLLNMEQELRWIEPPTFDEQLKTNTKKKQKTGVERKIGELFVIAQENYYDSHSAIYLGEGKYLQKKGSGPLQITDYTDIRKTYIGQTITRYYL